MSDYHIDRNKWRNREIIVDVIVKIVGISIFIFILCFAIFN